MKTISPGLFLTPDLWAQMEADVSARLTEEACGFVIGKKDTPKRIIPVTNVLHDPYRFRMDPQEELKAFLLVEDSGEEILAIYHSHPHGIDHPSPTDIEELTFPGLIYLIWYQAADKWNCRAYRMEVNSPPAEVAVMVSTNIDR
jgi:[CysO sulfur-carrier protein]-S-L-cysteine hydrolase